MPTFLKPRLAAILLLALSWRPEAPAAGIAPLPGVTDEQAEIAIDADNLTFERQHKLVRAEGNVVITRGDEVLRADRVVLHTATRQAHASGNVRFERQNMQWQGERFAYNFNTRRWASGAFTSFIDPFHLTAAAAENLPPDEILMHQCFATTCELPMDQAHYRVRAAKVRLRPDDRLLAHHAVLYLGRLPVFYSPVWRASLDPDFGFRIEPGYRGRMGTYLLTSYRYRINPVWRGQTHLDYRSRRGLAAGQDLLWDAPRTRAYSGRLSVYYINDRDPYLDRDPETLDIDSSRYRLKGQYRHQWTYRDHMQSHLEYVSDEKMREDFFERDYRRAVQPDNFASYLHRRDKMTFGLLTRMRLNDFYDSIDRLPEATVDLHRRQIGETPFYYQSHNAAAALWKRHAAGADEDDVNLTRLDSRHVLTYPARVFGFLNLIPRTGGQATFYSRTFRDETITETVFIQATNQTANANGNTATTFIPETRTREVRRDTGGDVRGLVELGMEVSFQAFRIWHTEPTAWGQDLRHVVEPYMDYTLIPEPSLRPDRLHQFDETDSLDKFHGIDFGVRNILQTKRGQRSRDLLDINVFSTYRLDADSTDNALEDVNLRAEARPDDHWRINLTAVYDTADSTLKRLNARWRYSYANLWETEFDYRYRHESSSLISGTLLLMPGPNWHYEIHGRYEAETSSLEEHAWFIQRNLDCMVIRTGFSHLPAHIRDDGSEKEDEYRATLEVWLTAFPEMQTGVSRRH